MRRVVTTELVSMDGVVESPDEWAFSYTDDVMAAEDAAGMAASDALLLYCREPFLSALEAESRESGILDRREQDNIDGLRGSFEEFML